MKNLFLLLFASLLLVSCGKTTEPKTIYIVRHGEKKLEGNDPELAYVGTVRATKLAQILKDQDIKHVYSTDYIRTKSTGKPTAEQAGLEIEIYDPKNADALIQLLKTKEGNALVVGHSNTVSQLANYFVGDGEKFKDLDDSEYEFIYVVTLDAEGEKVVRKVYKDF